jgi:hypothetical protein
VIQIVYVSKDHIVIQIVYVSKDHIVIQIVCVSKDHIVIQIVCVLPDNNRGDVIKFCKLGINKLRISLAHTICITMWSSPTHTICITMWSLLTHTICITFLFHYYYYYSSSTHFCPLDFSEMPWSNFMKPCRNIICHVKLCF